MKYEASVHRVKPSGVARAILQLHMRPYLPKANCRHECVTLYTRSCRVNDSPRSWPILLRLYSGIRTERRVLVPETTESDPSGLGGMIALKPVR